MPYSPINPLARSRLLQLRSTALAIKIKNSLPARERLQLPQPNHGTREVSTTIVPMRFSLRPFVLFSAIFIVEVCIAIFVRDRFIRPLVGDVLVVALIFYFVKSFFAISNLRLSVGVLVFAWAIEVAQYFNIVEVLGLGNVTVARVVIGTTFDWHDLVAYTIGAIAVFGFESRIERRTR